MRRNSVRGARSSDARFQPCFRLVVGVTIEATVAEPVEWAGAFRSRLRLRLRKRRRRLRTRLENWRSA